MALREEFESTGAWLFRWRSYLGFAFLPLLGLGIYEAARASAVPISTLWLTLCCTVSLFGLAVRVHCVGHAPPRTSGRNTRKQVADELNTTGVYSIVRHPLYLGNFLIALGLVLLPGHGMLAMLFVLMFAMYYERIMFAEEAFLRTKFAANYARWAESTPAIIPRFGNWTKSPRPFDASKTVRRECAALAVIVVGFSAVQMAFNVIACGMIALTPAWYGFTAIGATLYLVARVMKSRTRQNFPADRTTPLNNPRSPAISCFPPCELAQKT